jgi:hypothetical protein
MTGYQPSPIDNWISNGNTYINNKEKKPAQICFQSKRPHTITKMNDNLTMDSTIARSMNDNINMDSTIARSMNDNLTMDSIIAGSENACI